MMDSEGNSWDTESGLAGANGLISMSTRNTDETNSLSTLASQTLDLMNQQQIQLPTSPPPYQSLPNPSMDRSTLEMLTRSSSETKLQKKKKRSQQPGQQTATPQSINYRGIHIYQAAEQGSLPLCVLLWGMASAKRVNLFAPDAQGNTPLHHAAMADSPEVIGFLLQQSKVLPPEEMKLVEQRNSFGETALLRCMSRGVLSVAKALVESGSDPLVTDFQGNSIFTKLAKSGHIWCLNFMYHTVCTVYGAQIALELMSTLDNEAHSPLDWASDAGNVNVIEFFIRKGLNPYRTDALNRSPLYWAVKANRVAAARFLVRCGCNPLQVDGMNQTPLSIAKANGNRKMVEVLSLMGASYGKVYEQDSTSIQWKDPFRTPPLAEERRKKKHSHAIYQHNHTNRLMSLLFAVCFFALWILTVFMPWYAWLLAVGLAYYAYKRFEKKYEAEEDPKKFVSADDLLMKAEDDLVKKILMSPEKGVGLWLATMTVYVVYLLSCFYYDFDGYREKGSPDYKSLRYVDIQNIFHIGGIDGGRNTIWILWIAMFCTMMSIGTWLYVVWWNRDPGIVNTRDADFEEVLAQSLQANGAPPSSAYCRTTMVKKPLRSKYCVKTGAVVARMDHYCIWLNTTIGHGNHRSFILLLFSHFFMTLVGCALTIRGLFDDTHRLTSCGVAGALLNREYFFVTVLCVCFFVATLALGALVLDQCANIAMNMTTNERLNSARYHWISKEDGHNARNKFDRGTWNNILEFWRVPGYSVDYMKSFDLPPTLTQENIRSRNSQAEKLLMSYSGHQTPSGPPSIDLEVARKRAESIDSTDTSNGMDVV